MVRFRVLWFFVLLIFTQIYPENYLYPVVATRGEDGIDYLYIVHQISLYQVELWAWNPVTTQAHKILPSTSVPAGLRLLPDGSGFSFIDNGLIKIKKNNKRSASTLVLSDSLYDVGLIEWLDAETAYCSAKKRERFGIYQFTTQGKTKIIAGSIAYDCMYPFKVGSSIFYIERSEVDPGVYNYEVICLPYNGNSNAFRYKYPAQPKAIANFGSEPLAFLHMHSEKEGFVIAYKAELKSPNSSFLFTYYHLTHTTDWQASPLFSFRIPSQLLISLGNDRIHESILPLVPSSAGNFIYFVDSKDGQTLNLYSYNKLTGKILQLTNGSKGTTRFPAFPFKDFLYYGGTVRDATTSECPYLRYDERGLVFITLPSL